MTRPATRRRTAHPIDRVPGPLRRVARGRLRLVALGLIGAVLVAASLLQSTSSQLLQQTLDANWRGDYDILVTAAGASPLVEGGETLLPPSAVTDASLGHLSDVEVARVQGLEGVEVAAPIGEISTTTTGVSKVTLTIPLDGSADGPRAYRATTSLLLDDGITEPRTVRGSVDFVVDQSAWTGFPTDADTDTGAGGGNRIRVVTSTGEVGYGLETDVAANIDYIYGDAGAADGLPPGQGVVALTLPVEAVQTAHLVLVDPVEEKKLLGASGSVMDPLIATSQLIGRTADHFFSAANPPAPGDDLLTLFDKGVASQPMPVLTRTVEHPSSTLSVELAALDTPEGVAAQALQGITDDGGGVRGVDLSHVSAAPAGSPTTIYTGDPGDALSPLSFAAVDIGWPGFTLPPQPSYASYPLFRLAGSPILSSIAPEAASVARPTVIAADDPDARPTVELTASGVDDGELLFTTLSPIPSVEAAGLGPSETATWPVGSFTPEELQPAGAGLGRVGLGYDVADPLALDASGSPAAAVPASWSGLGLNVSGALGVADLENAQYLNVDEPVSSIRVRVAGVAGYTPEAQARILDVAARIRALGLTATVVAGSSFETVPVTLRAPEGAVGATGSGGAVVASGSGGAPTAASAASAGGAPAPVVALEYSRLGAAASAADGVSATDLALVVMAMVAGAALLVTVQLGSVAARRGDTVVLRQIGWPRARIRRWLVAEEAVALVVLAALAAAALLLSAVPEVTLPLAVLAVAASAAISAVLVLRGSRPEAPPRVGGRAAARPRPTTPDALGVRLASARRSSTTTLALGFALLFLATATAVVVVRLGGQAAGATRLGRFASASALLPQGVLITVTLVSACALILVVRRLGLARRHTETDALRAMGWQRRHLGRAAIAEVLGAAVPGLVVGATAAVVGSLLVAPVAVVPAVLAGSAATALVTAAVVRASVPRADARAKGWRRPGSRSRSSSCRSRPWPRRR
ncbi:hypothetical protein [Herbiconiux sp. A18JL235]|uniref:FtsX-like permease family protein n=1 Tax=Herbiconiux sp. A18JL235 TaxID=3152363 RepID=A0AB39BFS9_9MICO